MFMVLYKYFKIFLGVFFVKIFIAIFLILALTIFATAIGTGFMSDSQSIGRSYIITLVIIFIFIQLLFCIGLSEESISVWDYATTFVGGVAAIILLLEGVSSMGRNYRDEYLPLIEVRLDNVIDLYADFHKNNCMLSESNGGYDTPIYSGGDVDARKAEVEGLNYDILFLCGKVVEVRNALLRLDRPIIKEQIADIYRDIIEPLPNDVRYSRNRALESEIRPLAQFRQGTSLISSITRTMSRQESFSRSDDLLKDLVNATQGPGQFFWAIFLWLVFSIRCAIVLAIRQLRRDEQK